jgi:3-oxoacyl-[acyl-carrier-protein] synthase II
MNNRRVVITGMGTVSPFGKGIDIFWDSIVNGISAAHMIKSFDSSLFQTRFGAEVPFNDEELDTFINNKKSIKTMSRAIKFAVIAADEAVKNSEINIKNLDPYRFGISVGCGGLGLWDVEYFNQLIQIIFSNVIDKNISELDLFKIWHHSMEYVHPLTPLKALPNMPAAHIAINYNARGHCQTISTACTSSTQAFGDAFKSIKDNSADIMITGGTDAMINPNGLSAFSKLGVLSQNNEEFRTASRPFDKSRDGFMIGEGSAIFILEELEYCQKRGGIPLAEIMGYGDACDAYRLTDGPSDAHGSIHAMKLALKSAKINPDNIDYINAHGTGTQLNDKTETFAIKSVFGKRADKLPISSNKSMIGHLVAAAGAIELLACVKTILSDTIPPTINYSEPDPECDLDYVPNTARKKRVNTILSNSFGFGGQNACIIIKDTNNN